MIVKIIRQFLLWNVKINIQPRFLYRNVGGIKWFFDSIILLGCEFQHGDDYRKEMNQFRLTITILDINIHIRIISKEAMNNSYGIKCGE